MSNSAAERVGDPSNTLVLKIGGVDGAGNVAVFQIDTVTGALKFTGVTRGGSKGATVGPLDITYTDNGADHRGLDVVEQFAPGYEDGSAGVAAFAQKGVVGATYSRLPLGSAFASNAFNFRASAGQVAGLVLVNRNAAVRIFGLVNKASTPISGDAIVLPIPVPAASTIVIGDDFLGRNGFYLSTGVSGAFFTSSTGATLATAGEHDMVAVGY